MRCFLALDFPVEVKQEIEAAVVRAKRLGVRASFVPIEQTHVTLAFFGEVNEAEAEKIKEVAARECADAAAFKVKAKGIGFLPDERRPRVLYAAVDSPGLTVLQKKLAVALRYDEGRAFHAHATIARLKPGVYRDALAQLREEFERVDFGEFVASEVVLKKSVLGAEGAQHSVIARFPLQFKDSASAT
jgi:2'-5' RNA ligase